MDLLKRELQRKRELLQEDFAGRKFLKRSEIQRKEIQRLRQEEHRRHCPRPEPVPSAPERSTAGGAGYRTSGDLPLLLHLPRDEVIRRLRVLKQPATLFGEDDAARLHRLNEVIESGPVEIEEEEIGDGQTNDFLRDIQELRRRQRAGVVKPKNGGAGEATEAADAAGKECSEESDGCRRSGGDEDAKRMKTDFAELCNEDKILVFFKNLLDEWGQEVEGMPEAEKRTAKGKFTVATFNQCARYLNPLFKMCRKKSLPDDIGKALLSVAECCLRRDYLTAMDEYIKLAIGNAPWPIGVTMVGIHERSAREKIYTNSMAHIMNDETTRKYLQSVKRLMTFCQRRYPANPSRSVEFNSLANGSDLQSLLAEERVSKSLTSTESLRLVSAK